MAVEFNKGTPAGAFLSKGSAVVATRPLTIFAWFNVAALGDYALACVTRTDGFADFEFFVLELHSDGDVWAAELGTGFTLGIGTKGTYTTNTWHTAAAVYETNVSRTAYLDGVAGTTNTDLCFEGTHQDTIVGARRLAAENTFRGLTGCEVKVCFWDIALTPANIATLSDGIHTPEDVEPDHILDLLELTDAGTAVAAKVWDSGSGMLVADADFESHPGDGSIETCATSPVFASRARTYNRIWG